MKKMTAEQRAFYLTEPEHLLEYIIKTYGAALTKQDDRMSARVGWGLCAQVAAAKRIAVSEVVQHVQAEYKRLHHL
jgi:hypothetical protein